MNEDVLRFQPLPYRRKMFVEHRLPPLWVAGVHTHNSGVDTPGYVICLHPFVHWTVKPIFGWRFHQGPDSTWERSARIMLPWNCGTSPLMFAGTMVGPCCVWRPQPASSSSLTAAPPRPEGKIALQEKLD